MLSAHAPRMSAVGPPGHRVGKDARDAALKVQLQDVGVLRAHVVENANLGSAKILSELPTRWICNDLQNCASQGSMIYA